jgi:hypothetical protein
MLEKVSYSSEILNPIKERLRLSDLPARYLLNLFDTIGTKLHLMMKTWIKFIPFSLLWSNPHFFFSTLVGAIVPY